MGDRDRSRIFLILVHVPCIAYESTARSDTLDFHALERESGRERTARKSTYLQQEKQDDEGYRAHD